MKPEEARVGLEMIQFSITGLAYALLIGELSKEDLEKMVEEGGIGICKAIETLDLYLTGSNAGRSLREDMTKAVDLMLKQKTVTFYCSDERQTALVVRWPSESNMNFVSPVPDKEDEDLIMERWERMTRAESVNWLTDGKDSIAENG